MHPPQTRLQPVPTPLIHALPCLITPHPRTGRRGVGLTDSRPERGQYAEVGQNLTIFLRVHVQHLEDAPHQLVAPRTLGHRAQTGRDNERELFGLVHALHQRLLLVLEDDV